MAKRRKAWCSWCCTMQEHELVAEHVITRNEYRCLGCGNYSVKCRACSNMARLRPAVTPEDEGYLKSLAKKWGSEFCAEHDGSIADFEKLTLRLDSLEEYKTLFERKRNNLKKASRITCCTVGAVVISAPLACLAAPGVAAALGSWGVLGSAGTGTAISTLHGAALTSASLAAIGPGGMAGGVVCLTATGGSLGGVLGGAIGNSYFGAIKDFGITKVRDGKGPALVFINGFLSQKNPDASKWLEGIKHRFPKNPCYLVTWESSRLYKLGKFIGDEARETAFAVLVTKAMKRGSRRFFAKMMPWNSAATLATMARNPWHVSMYKANMTGILLADLLARTNHKDGFILMGSSLGARVIYYTLTALATKDNSPVVDAYLFGGAVGRDKAVEWERAASAVRGKLYNFYSDKDWVLKVLYRTANAFTSRPIGLGPIDTPNTTIVNIDASKTVKGHMMYKPNLAEILETVEQ